MKVATIGLDIAKNVFQVHGVDGEGVPVLRRKVRRYKLLGCLLTWNLAQSIIRSIRSSRRFVPTSGRKNASTKLA